MAPVICSSKGPTRAASPSSVGGSSGAGIARVIGSREGPTRAASPSAVVVSAEARISPLSGSTARWSLRQVRRPRSPCVSASHSPAPCTFSPVAPATRAPGPPAAGPLPPGGGDPDVPRSGSLGLRQRAGERQAGTAPGEGGVVGNADAQAEQAGQRAQQALGLPPGPAEGQARQVPALDRDVRARARAAPPAAPRRA